MDDMILMVKQSRLITRKQKSKVVVVERMKPKAKFSKSDRAQAKQELKFIGV